MATSATSTAEVSTGAAPWSAARWAPRWQAATRDAALAGPIPGRAASASADAEASPASPPNSAMSASARASALSPTRPLRSTRATSSASRRAVGPSAASRSRGRSCSAISAIDLDICST